MIKILILTVLLAASPVCSEIFNPFNLPRKIFLTQDVKICKSLWSKEGSACNSTELEDYAMSQSNLFLESASVFKQEIKNIRDKLSNSDNRLNNATDVNLQFYKRFSNDFLIKEMLDATDNCVNYQKPERNNALCFICSGKASQYFFKSKAIVSSEQCSGMLNKCSAFYTFSLDIVQGFVELGTILNQRLDAIRSDYSNWIQHNSKVRFFKEKVEELNDLLVKADLKNLLHKYQNGKDAKVEASLCARLYTVNQKPAIFWFGLLLSFVNRNIGDYVKVLNRLNSRLLFSQQARHLQDLYSLGSSNMFSGDVVVFSSQDNMFTSYDGVTGSSNSINSDNKKPMNLSMIFP